MLSVCTEKKHVVAYDCAAQIRCNFDRSSVGVILSVAAMARGYSVVVGPHKL